MTPQWLDEREARAWRGFHAMRTQLLAHLGRQLTPACNVTQSEFEILITVSEAPGHRIRFRDLSNRLQWERSRLSHQIARMEARGTISRAECESDARGFDVVLTPAGLATVELAAPINLEAVRHCFVDVLTAEQLDVLGDIAEAITAHLADCSRQP